MQIIKVKNGAYEQYESLLLKRDHYRKEAGQRLISYHRLFGDLINAVFEKQITCIRWKKAISLCQACINRGETPDLDAMNRQIEDELKQYYAELEEMLWNTETAKRMRLVPEITVIQVKKLYRKLARMLHPDINPHTNNSYVLKDLWNRITAAYHGNDLKELQELELLAAAALADMNEEEMEIDIPDIEEKISRLEQEINEIISTEPYLYGRVLMDPDLQEQKKTELQKELDEYDAYAKELEETFNQLLSQTGGRFTWRMN